MTFSKSENPKCCKKSGKIMPFREHVRFRKLFFFHEIHVQVYVGLRCFYKFWKYRYFSGLWPQGTQGAECSKFAIAII